MLLVFATPFGRVIVEILTALYEMYVNYKCIGINLIFLQLLFFIVKHFFCFSICCVVTERPLKILFTFL